MEIGNKDTDKCSLNLPPYEAKTRFQNGKKEIFDELRRQYVALTPEEWVRQHFVHYLTKHLSYPIGRLANEYTIKLNNNSRRCDTVVFDGLLQPLMIIEYKAPNITLSDSVWRQIAAYNTVLHVPYLIISNGINHHCCHIDYQSNCWQFLTQFPTYEQLNRREGI